MRKIAFVPIRSGSKGIAGKNTKLLCGKPLVCWILDTLAQSRLFDEVWLATDNAEAGGMAAERYGSKVRVYRRTDSSARDDAPVMAAVREFTAWRGLADDDWLCLFQATSPFTSAADIGMMLRMTESGLYDSIVSCVRLRKFRWAAEGAPLDYQLGRKPRRQDYGGFLVESGSFYSARVAAVKSAPYILSGRVGIVEVDPLLAVDIDEPRDWAEAEHIARETFLGR